MTSSTQEPDLATEGDVIKERWKIIKKLGGGGFGEIYECSDTNIKSTVAIKLESSKLPKQVLRMEVSVLKKLQGTKHACKCHGYGRNDKYSYVAMTLQGKNLADLRRQMRNACFTISTTMQLTLQIIDAIENIHAIGFLHRDIKPSNFAMGGSSDTSRIVYMLDFGLARQYVLNNSTTLEVRPPREVAGFRGTVRYASVNAHNNVEMGRHDDLWSAFYMIVEMLTGQLPWRRIKDKEQVGQLKQSYDHTKLLQNLPPEMKGFLTHIQSLDYFRKPDYDYLRNQINECMIRCNIQTTDLYDWEIVSNNSTTTTTTTTNNAGGISNTGINLVNNGGDTGLIGNTTGVAIATNGVAPTGGIVMTTSGDKRNSSTCGVGAGVMRVVSSTPQYGTTANNNNPTSITSSKQQQPGLKNQYVTTEALANPQHQAQQQTDDVSNNNLHKSKHRGESVIKMKKYSSNQTGANNGAVNCSTNTTPNQSDNNQNNNPADNPDNPISASAKSSYRHAISSAKSDKSGRASMPPLSPRSAFVSNKDRKMEAKFTEDLIDTPRGGQGPSETTTAAMTTNKDNPTTQPTTSTIQNNRRKRESTTTPTTPTTPNNHDLNKSSSRLPVLHKTGSNNSIDCDPPAPQSQARSKKMEEQKSTTPNLPPKPNTTTTTTKTTTAALITPGIKKTVQPLNSMNFLTSIGGSIATNAVNDEQFDISNAPDATKAVHLTQMSNQDDDDDDDVDDDDLSDNKDDVDNDLKLVQRNAIDNNDKKNYQNEADRKEDEKLSNYTYNKQQQKVTRIIAPNNEQKEKMKIIMKIDSEKSISYKNDKSISNKQSVAKIQAQLTDKSRAINSIENRLANGIVAQSGNYSSGPGSSERATSGAEEDSSNCRSKESHELEQTFSKARTSTSGYVSGGPVGGADMSMGSQKMLASVGGGINSNAQYLGQPQNTISSSINSRSGRPRSSSGGGGINNQPCATRLPPRSSTNQMGPTGDLITAISPPLQSSEIMTSTAGQIYPNSPSTPTSQKTTPHSTNRRITDSPNQINADYSDVSISRSSRRHHNHHHHHQQHQSSNRSSGLVISAKDMKSQYQNHHNFQNINHQGDNGNINSSQNYSWNRNDSRPVSGYTMSSSGNVRQSITSGNSLNNSSSGAPGSLIGTGNSRPTPKPRTQRTSVTSNTGNNNTAGSNSYNHTSQHYYRSQSQLSITKDPTSTPSRRGIPNDRQLHHSNNKPSSHTRQQQQQQQQQHQQQIHRSSSRDSLNTSLSASIQHHKQLSRHKHTPSPLQQSAQHPPTTGAQYTSISHKRRSTSFCSSTDSVHRCGATSTTNTNVTQPNTTNKHYNSKQNISSHHHHHHHHQQQQQQQQQQHHQQQQQKQYSRHPSSSNKSVTDLIERVNYYAPSQTPSCTNNNNNNSIIQASPKRSLSINRSQSADILTHMVRKKSKTLSRTNQPTNTVNTNGEFNKTTSNRHSYKKVRREDTSSHSNHYSNRHYRLYYARSKSNNEEDLSANTISPHTNDDHNINDDDDGDDDDDDDGNRTRPTSQATTPPQPSSSSSLYARHRNISSSSSSLINKSNGYNYSTVKSIRSRHYLK